MNSTVLSFLFKLFSTPLEGIRAYRKHTMDLARLKMSLLYLKSIEVFRLLFISLLSVGVCLFFLVGGLVLFHAVLFLYAPWDATTKMLVGFSLSFIYLGISVGAFMYIFSQAKWLKIFYADDIINNLMMDDAEKEEDKEQSNPNRNGDRVHN